MTTRGEHLRPAAAGWRPSRAEAMRRVGIASDCWSMNSRNAKPASAVPMTISEPYPATDGEQRRADHAEPREGDAHAQEVPHHGVAARAVVGRVLANADGRQTAVAGAARDRDERQHRDVPTGVIDARGAGRAVAAAARLASVPSGVAADAHDVPADHPRARLRRVEHVHGGTRRFGLAPGLGLLRHPGKPTSGSAGTRALGSRPRHARRPQPRLSRPRRDRRHGDLRARADPAARRRWTTCA